MKVTFTILLLLITFNLPSRKLSPKEERILIEKRLDNSEKELLKISKKIDKILILKNK